VWPRAACRRGRGERLGGDAADGDPLDADDAAAWDELEVIAADEGDVGHRDDAPAGIAGRVAEGAELVEVPVPGVQAGLGLECAACGLVEGLVGVDEDTRQGPLAGVGGLVAPDEEDVPGVGDLGAGSEGEEDDVDGDHGVALEPPFGLVGRDTRDLNSNYTPGILNPQEWIGRPRGAASEGPIGKAPLAGFAR